MWTPKSWHEKFEPLEDWSSHSQKFYRQLLRRYLRHPYRLIRQFEATVKKCLRHALARVAWTIEQHSTKASQVWWKQNQVLTHRFKTAKNIENFCSDGSWGQKQGQMTVTGSWTVSYVWTCLSITFPDKSRYQIGPQQDYYFVSLWCNLLKRPWCAFFFAEAALRAACSSALAAKQRFSNCPCTKSRHLYRCPSVKRLSVKGPSKGKFMLICATTLSRIITSGEWRLVLSKMIEGQQRLWQHNHWILAFDVSRSTVHSRNQFGKCSSLGELSTAISVPPPPSIWLRMLSTWHERP